MSIETIKTPKGTLTTPLSIAILRLVTECGACDLRQIANNVPPLNVKATESDLVALRRRLRDLCEGLHIHRVLIGDVLHWRAGPDPEEDDEEAMPAVRTAAPPRRINVMAGHYIPERAPVLRPGSDHRHLQSRGHRC